MLVKKYKHKKTGVILEYKNDHFYIDNELVPNWYVKLHLGFINTDEWCRISTFEINYVKDLNGCICGHNGQTYDDKQSTIHQITVYPFHGGKEKTFKIGDYVSNGTPMRGNIVKFNLSPDGVPYITTDWSNIGMSAWSCYHIMESKKIDWSCYHTREPKKIDIQHLSQLEKF